MSKPFFAIYRKHTLPPMLVQVDDIHLRYWMRDRWSGWDEIRNQESFDEYKAAKITELQAVRFVLKETS